MDVNSLNLNQNGRTFGKRIKQRRVIVGLTQANLARKIGIAKSTIQTYESGAFPKGDSIIKLSRVLECTTDWLLTGEGPPDPAVETLTGPETDVITQDLVAFYFLMEALKETGITLSPRAMNDMLKTVIEKTLPEFQFEVANKIKSLRVAPHLRKKATGINKLRGMGTVFRLDLTHHEVFGRVEVELDNLDFQTLMEYAFDQIPDRTDYQKKCKNSVWGWLSNEQFEVMILPVLNKKVMKEYGDLILEREDKEGD